jgi:hypothetical protein
LEKRGGDQKIPDPVARGRAKADRGRKRSPSRGRRKHEPYRKPLVEAQSTSLAPESLVIARIGGKRREHLSNQPLVPSRKSETRSKSSNPRQRRGSKSGSKTGPKSTRRDDDRRREDSIGDSPERDQRKQRRRVPPSSSRTQRICKLLEYQKVET